MTPAHDPVDFEIAGRHALEPVVVIDVAGVITEEGGDFAGMDRMEARKAVRASLDEEGLLAGVESHHHAVGHCSRCGTVVEPMLSLQWFVRVDALVGPAVEAVTSGDTRFVPDRWRTSTCSGWATCATGASADSCGGVTGSPPGTATPVPRCRCPAPT